MDSLGFQTARVLFHLEHFLGNSVCDCDWLINKGWYRLRTICLMAMDLREWLHQQSLDLVLGNLIMVKYYRAGMVLDYWRCLALGKGLCYSNLSMVSWHLLMVKYYRAVFLLDNWRCLALGYGFCHSSLWLDYSQSIRILGLVLNNLVVRPYYRIWHNLLELGGNPNCMAMVCRNFQYNHRMNVL